MDKKWHIAYYETSQSGNPAHDFIQQLDPKAKSKVVNTIDLLEAYGIRLGLPHVKKLTGTDLWELRVLGKDNIRIFFVTMPGQSLLLLHGFVKKKQKTDTREIKTALDRLQDYHVRKQN